MTLPSLSRWFGSRGFRIGTTISNTFPKHYQHKQVLFRSLSSIPSWATCDPEQLGRTDEVYAVSNIVGGKRVQSSAKIIIPNPMDKTTAPIFTIPDTHVHEIDPFVTSLRACPKTGLHNPLKNPERYVQYGEISRKVRESIVEHEQSSFFQW